jgi:glycosyltransferase involved in cell wall biosynthesis
MSGNIRVIHIITRLDMGGSAQEALFTAINLDPHNYIATLIKGSTIESLMTEDEIKQIENQLVTAEKHGIKVINLPSLVRRISPFNDIRAFISIFRILQRSKPDIVHTHTSKAGGLGRLAAWLARVPVIIHKPHGHVFYGHFRPLQSRFFLLVERLLGRITHHLIALTPHERNDYLGLSVSKPNNTSVIHSGVDLVRFQKGKKRRSRKRKELGIPSDSLVVGFVGWLLPIKGVNFLIQAMAGVVKNHPKGLLVLVGKGEDERKLKKQAKNLGLTDKVLFLGWRPDVDEIMGCFDVFVLPSLNEGMGRVLVEAMAVGLPIVASRVGGIPDLVKDGKNGYLVPPADSAALEGAISDLFQDNAKRKRLGKAGKKMCRPYSTEAMVEQINNLYARLLEQYS